VVQMDTHSAVKGDGGAQFLSFRLDAEEYAIDILGVQEIKGFSTITAIPNAPPYILGVMNLRGTVVPVVSLRERFGMKKVPYDKFTVIVVVAVSNKVVGVVVDAVTDVLNLRKAEIEAVPDLGPKVDVSFIKGVAKPGDRLVVVLDMDRAIGDAVTAVVDAERADRPSP